MANFFSGLWKAATHPVDEAKWWGKVVTGKTSLKKAPGEHQRMMNEITVPILGDNKVAKNSDAVVGTIFAGIFAAGAMGAGGAASAAGSGAGSAAGGAAGTAAGTSASTGAMGLSTAFTPATSFGAGAGSAAGGAGAAGGSAAGAGSGLGLTSASFTPSTAFGAGNLGTAGSSFAWQGSAAGLGSQTGLSAAGTGWGGSAAGQGGLGAQTAPAQGSSFDWQEMSRMMKNVQPQNQGQDTPQARASAKGGGGLSSNPFTKSQAELYGAPTYRKRW